MKIRVKYSKIGAMKYVGHLDMMRYFQKAIRRAGLDVMYSQGYSPHQLISFAAPLGLSVTSGGEYFDAQMNSVLSGEEMIQRLNETMADGIRVEDVVLLREGEKPAMSVVAGSDYMIARKEDAEQPLSEEAYESLCDAVTAYLAQPEIMVVKKSKTKERLLDIKPLIYKMHLQDDGIYMLISSGSVDHLKPELVMQSLCAYAGLDYERAQFRVHRVETYMRDPEGNLVSLLWAGDPIL